MRLPGVAIAAIVDSCAGHKERVGQMKGTYIDGPWRKFRSRFAALIQGPAAIFPVLRTLQGTLSICRQLLAC